MPSWSPVIKVSAVCHRAMSFPKDASIAAPKVEELGTEMAIIEYDSVASPQREVEYDVTNTNKFRTDGEFLTSTPEEHYFLPQGCFATDKKTKIIYGLAGTAVLLALILSMVALSRSPAESECCSRLELEVLRLRADFAEFKATVQSTGLI